MNDSKNVTTAKPKVGGAASYAPVGTKVPADATSVLDAAFKGLGYISEDGVVNSNSFDSDNIKAWGGDIVDASESGKTDTFQFTLIESLLPDVRKAVFNDENVSGDLASGMTTRFNSKEHKHHAWVFDEVLKDDALQRIVIPDGKVTAVGDITHSDGTLLGYQITVLAFPSDAIDGDTHREYTVRATASTGTEEQ